MVYGLLLLVSCVKRRVNASSLMEVLIWSRLFFEGVTIAIRGELVHMARLSPPDRRSTLILLTPDGDGVWYGPGAPLGLRLTDGCRDWVDIIGICAPRYNGAQYASS